MSRQGGQGRVCQENAPIGTYRATRMGFESVSMFAASAVSSFAGGLDSAQGHSEQRHCPSRACNSHVRLITMAGIQNSCRLTCPRFGRLFTQGNGVRREKMSKALGSLEWIFLAVVMAGRIMARRPFSAANAKSRRGDGRLRTLRFLV